MAKRNKKILLLGIIILVIATLLAVMTIPKLIYQAQTRQMKKKYEAITVTSSAFGDGGTIPIEYTGRGSDISPDLRLSGISKEAVTIAVIMDDMDFYFGVYTHWVIWNIPTQEIIPQAIPHKTVVEELGGAVQGNAFGRHRYRGPLPPFGSHRYQFNVYVLDCELELDESSGKKELLRSMEGHILQYGTITGRFE